jgi:hypothetical protein
MFSLLPAFSPFVGEAAHFIYVKVSIGKRLYLREIRPISGSYHIDGNIVQERITP